MKKYTLLILAILMMAMECENRKFSFIATIDYDKTYVVDQAGPFDESATITRSEVLDMFDIPDDATIKSVNIENISAKVVVLDGNQASSVLLSGYLKLGSGKKEVFNNFPAVLTAVDASFIGLNSLIADGVNGIKTKLEAYLMGSDTAPFEMHVAGDSAPSGSQQINVQIIIKIKGNAEWERCEEVPWFIEGGESC
jgi:hypothetical protein